MRFRLSALSALLLALCFSIGAAAQDSLPLFADEAILEVSIEGPLDTLMRERSDEEYYDGVLRYADGAEVHSLDLRFRTRGNFRRRKETCRFPPVRLNFKKQQVEGTLFEGQNILKLVTHCRPNSGRYEEYVVRELLAYRIFNRVTPVSFRARQLRITWVNTEDGNDEDVRYGFLIEHKNELEDRLQLEEPGYNSIQYDALNPQQAALAAVFQYMIGNTDFSMVTAVEGEACCHNGILLQKSRGDIYFVPYDFDMAGIVDAPYAAPNPRFRLRSVTSRLYRGDCLFNDYLDEAIGRFAAIKNDVEELIATQEGLERRA
ncbi:MAG: hypothetical protein R3315_13560, partial [Woeseiaceae bacterium]|nr:hypothetical protein [Woeseiaceae bacterium]